MDEDSEIASMEVSSKEKTDDIDFRESNEAVYATCPSEIQKDNEEVVVLFESFENQGFENPSTGALDCEIVHVVNFSHLLEDYEQELIFIHSFESKVVVLKQISRNLMKPLQSCLMNKRIALMHIIRLSYLKMFKNM